MRYMNRKKILIAAFILVALVQLFVPAKMIWNRERIIDSGTEFKFKTEPIDPTDPFRGKYITLRYDENTFQVEDESEWYRDEDVYVSLKTDDEGFVKISAVSKGKPMNDNAFVMAKVRYTSYDSTNTLTIRYPFDRYYMEESKAYEAEKIHRQSQRDSSHLTYALVSIRDGKAVLKDVLIDEVSIREIVKNRQKEIGY